jgi:hypothetical protein
MGIQLKTKGCKIASCNLNCFSFELGMKEFQGIEGRKGLISGAKQRICVLDSLKFLHS